MKLSGREDIDVAIEDAFGALTDVAYLERQLLRRGIDIVRTDGAGPVGEGAAWAADADWNGRRYPLDLQVAEWSPPGAALLSARSNGLLGDLRAELTALSKRSTRVRVTLVLRGTGFRDRMFLNSVSLAKARLSSRFSEAVSDFAKSLETRVARA